MARGGRRPNSGPKKGAIYKSKDLRFEVMERVQELGFNPVAALIDIHREAMELFRMRRRDSASSFGVVGALEVAHKTAMDLMAYTYARPAAVYVSTSSDEPQSFTELMLSIHLESQLEKDNVPGE